MRTRAERGSANRVIIGKTQNGCFLSDVACCGLETAFPRDNILGISIRIRHIHDVIFTNHFLILNGVLDGVNQNGIRLVVMLRINHHTTIDSVIVIVSHFRVFNGLCLVFLVNRAQIYKKRLNE